MSEAGNGSSITSNCSQVKNAFCGRKNAGASRVRASASSNRRREEQFAVVIAGLDPAIHPVRQKVLTKKTDHPKSGLPDFGRFKCASRVNPTCVVNGVPADNVGGVSRPAGDERVA